MPHTKIYWLSLQTEKQRAGEFTGKKLERNSVEG